MKTKENVKFKKISPQEAYDKLRSIVGEEYSKKIHTLRWLKNLINGRKITEDKVSRQERKQAFRKNFKK